MKHMKCPGCRKTKSLFRQEIQKGKKELNGIKFDILITKCDGCGYQYEDYSEQEKPRHWGRAKFQGLT